VRIGGAYIGLGLGDSSDEIAKIKAFMRRKFSYTAALDNSKLFDATMLAAVADMQSRYNASGQLATGSYTPGIINPETKFVMGYLARPPKVDARPMLFTVCGTGVSWWGPGPDSDTARAVEAQYRWQPIGYPAKPIPMGPSITEGRNELANQMTLWRDRIVRSGFALAGYSQGAIVVGECWEQEIKPEGGRLHWALPYIRKAVCWGNPMREKGKAYADPGGALSPIDHQGVTGTLMLDTPDWFRNYSHVGDLYSDCPDDQSGEDRTAIWQIIRNGNMVKGPDSLLSQFLELTGVKKDAPKIAEATGMVKAMIDAMVFFGKQTGPHVNYSPQPAIDFLRAT